MTWAEMNVADPSIIATAKVYGFAVLSLEVKNSNLRMGSPYPHNNLSFNTALKS